LLYEHGALVRSAGKTVAQNNSKLLHDWVEVELVMGKNTPSNNVLPERKKYSLVWHYRKMASAYSAQKTSVILKGCPLVR